MYAKIPCACLIGLEGQEVLVEADVRRGLPRFDMVGYLSSDVREARERLSSAIAHSGLSLPTAAITVNLAPANLRKSGNHYDFAIALSILGAAGRLPLQPLSSLAVFGELGLDGSIHPVDGLLNLLLIVKQKGYRGVLVPMENAEEAASVPGLQVYAFESLSALREALTRKKLVPYEKEGRERRKEDLGDFEDIIGQERAKRAAVISAAGRLNLLYYGPPGIGKSMLSSRIPSLLPDLDSETSVRLSGMYSLKEGSGVLKEGLLIRSPFRFVTPSIGRAALIGGGNPPTVGEISLAHGGYLFLEELAEYPRRIIDSLLIPMEEKKVRIQRNAASFEFPADCTILAAMNPCPCGNYPKLHLCTCKEQERRAYLRHISPAFLDRMDLFCEMEERKQGEGIRHKKGKSTADLRSLVLRAEEMRRARGQELPNGRISEEELRKTVPLSGEMKRFLEECFETLHLSMRSMISVLRIARTIADMEGKDVPGEEELLEAISFKRRAAGMGGGYGENI